MSILTAQNLSLSFGAFDVFSGVSVRIADKSKVGLIGPNGIGKTSLLLILVGLRQATTGSVHVARGRSLGYLRQESIEAFASRHNTVYAEMETVFAHLKVQETRLHEMEVAMEAGRFTEYLLEEYGALQAAFEQAGGYDYDVRIRRTLQGLGLGKEYWDKPLCQLSGGQQTRALLARLLLEEPDLLVLDEPTNHLDAQALDWLEGTLRDWQGAVLIVSHDRYFLDNVVDTIWEMNRSGVEIYAGNYSAYLQQRQERRERCQKVFSEEKARLVKELDFIQSNIARQSTNARAVGLLKRLSRDLAIIEAFGVMGLRSNQNWLEMDLGNVRPLSVIEAVRRINALSEPVARPPRLNLKLDLVHSSGKIVLRTQGLRAGYPGNPLFTADDIELLRAERAALIGPNGCGKTTFLKMVMGQLEPLEGHVHLGASLKVGYFAQAHDELDPEDTVINTVQRKRSLSVEQARNHLARYLFRGDDVFKLVGALSGGERSRLALALLALEGANFLLLDEPTNHLDLPAQEMLQEVLENFAGTILLVSHDRYLVSRLATQIWDVRDGQLRVYRGSYSQFLAHRAADELTTGPGALGRASCSKIQPPSAKRDQKARQRTQAMFALEARIQEREAHLLRLDQEIRAAGQAQTFEKLNHLSWEYAEAQAGLEKLLEQWEELAV
ncbi:MAG: ABC-F family ATP-binding cassette domain-containing protein [Anaerolineales bacterium]|nr:ABC-F family ATP-binding cassette domain-containing protein [Anaerolineales bacterium]